MKYKKWILFLMVLCFTLSLYGCQLTPGMQRNLADVFDTSQKEQIESLKEKFPDATVTAGKNGSVWMTRTVNLDTEKEPVEKQRHIDMGFRAYPLDWRKDYTLNRLDTHYIVLAHKAGDNRQFTHFDKTGQCIRFYSETPVQIEKVFYGDMEAGETITVYERAAVFEDSMQEMQLHCYQNETLIRGGQKYIMILEKRSANADTGKVVYQANQYCCVFPVDEEIQSAKDKNALVAILYSRNMRKYTGGYISTYADLVSKYILDPSPDLRINEIYEMRKLMETNLRRAATQEERIRLAALRDDPSATWEALYAELSNYQRDLVKRMCKKYGLK